MDKDKAPQVDLSAKYNLQALHDYDFGNINFDISFGEVTEKDLERMKKEQAVQLERLKKQKEQKK